MAKIDERKELLVTDMAEAFGPKEHISSTSSKFKWRSIPYETVDYSGTMLSAHLTSYPEVPEDISYNPNLKGFYKIYISVSKRQVNRLFIKLTSDETFYRFSNNYNTDIMSPELEETLWRVADMTDQTITITKKRDYNAQYATIASIRFVPLSDEEAAEYIKFYSNPKDKRLYVTDDLHNKFFHEHISDIKEFESSLLPFRFSDAEWFSPEIITILAGGKTPCPVDEYPFFRAGDRNVQTQIAKFDYTEILTVMTNKAHEMGLKVAPSIRMGAWGMQYPHDDDYFNCPFRENHPEWSCIDRLGEKTCSLSYAFPEVRKYMIDELVKQAKCGADAVTLISHRGIPYVLFEKPVADRYFELYGEYPYDLPLDNPKLNAVQCEFMTTFFKELRAALDAEFTDRKVEIHLRTMFTVLDSYMVGFDIEKLAAEKLVDAFISYPQRFYELYSDDIWTDETREHLDMDKYAAYIRTNDNTLSRPDGCNFHGQNYNSKGELVGPVDMEQRVKEWVAIKNKYGVKLYIDFFPVDNDDCKERAMNLYEWGVEGFALWDTYSHAWHSDMWHFSRKIGHKEEVKDFEPNKDNSRIHRVLSYNGINVNRFKPIWGG